MLSKSDYRYFEKAKKIAYVSDFYKVHIGCVAVYQNNIIGVGCNTKRRILSKNIIIVFAILGTTMKLIQVYMPKLIV